MINYSEVYIYSDQPVSCPKCGSRSDIILNFAHTNPKTEVHLCPTKNCNFEFVMQSDADFENGALYEGWTEN